MLREIPKGGEEATAQGVSSAFKEAPSHRRPFECSNACPRRASAAVATGHIRSVFAAFGADDLAPRRTWLSVVELVASKSLSRGILDFVSH
jgi:hypothetical protein